MVQRQQEELIAHLDAALCVGNRQDEMPLGLNDGNAEHICRTRNCRDDVTRRKLLVVWQN